MIDYAVLNEIGIDCRKAIERFSGNQALYEKYLFKFLEDTHCADGVEAYERGDHKGLLEMSHALKGIAGILGMNGLFQACSAVVQAIRGGHTDDLEEMVQAMEGAHKKYYDCICSMR